MLGGMLSPKIAQSGLTGQSSRKVAMGTGWSKNAEGRECGSEANVESHDGSVWASRRSETEGLEGL